MAEDNAVTIDRTLDAPIENVWKAWTDPDLILQWFGSDPKGTGIKARLDVRARGSYEVTFKDGDQTEHTCCGRYKEVKEFNKLSFTWTWKSEPAVQTLVTIVLAPEGNFTKMHFRHSRLGDSSGHNYKEGWQSTFAKLERILREQRGHQKSE